VRQKFSGSVQLRLPGMQCAPIPRTHPVLPLTERIPLPPHSAYNKSMRIGNHLLLWRLGSLLIVLCLLAAPLCATRCFLSSCAKTNTPEQSTTGCHHLSIHSRGSSAITGAIASTCLPVDSLLTTLPAPQSRMLSGDSDSHCLSAIQNSPSISATSSTIAFRISDRSSPPANLAAFVSNSPLRL
jgi:hypothetical protein